MIHYPSLRRRVSLVLISGTWVFLLLSLASFAATDWPSPAVYPYGPVANLCGYPGALVAYLAFYTIGPGVFPILLFVGLCLTLYILGRRISDIWLRAAGV